MSASFNKFNQFVQDLADGVHNFGTNTINVGLSNTAPVATNTVWANITEISAGNGYTAGGNAAAVTSAAQTAGVFKLILANPATWTASGTGMGPFRYAVIYNNTATSKNLIGWYDYGSSITLNSGEQFQVSFDATNGVLTIT
ncbi:hypothetical protein [Silvimonas sp.]|uniref:hypothetical protein n=1 Tax=Silvimonas sp. TaxID=2650811 RepID=UPI002845A86E|nr:hypothetical protein [Silvimonas sp.]MDR3427812.1 hypothetical protein [Silvimonas sp.]